MAMIEVTRVIVYVLSLIFPLLNFQNSKILMDSFGFITPINKIKVNIIFATIILSPSLSALLLLFYSTVTDFARFRGLSTSFPRIAET